MQVQPQLHPHQQLVIQNKFFSQPLATPCLSFHLALVCQYRAPCLDQLHQYQQIKRHHHNHRSELQMTHQVLPSFHGDESQSSHKISCLCQPSTLRLHHLASNHEDLIAKSDHHEPNLIQLICALVCHAQLARQIDPRQYQHGHQNESLKLYLYPNDLQCLQHQLRQLSDLPRAQSQLHLPLKFSQLLSLIL